MKSRMITLALLSLFAAPVFAGNEGPHGDPTEHPAEALENFPGRAVLEQKLSKLEAHRPAIVKELRLGLELCVPARSFAPNPKKLLAATSLASDGSCQILYFDGFLSKQKNETQLAEVTAHELLHYATRFDPKGINIIDDRTGESEWDGEIQMMAGALVKENTQAFQKLASRWTFGRPLPGSDQSYIKALGKLKSLLQNASTPDCSISIEEEKRDDGSNKLPLVRIRVKKNAVWLTGSDTSWRYVVYPVEKKSHSTESVTLNWVVGDVFNEREPDADVRSFNMFDGERQLKYITLRGGSSYVSSRHGNPSQTGEYNIHFTLEESITGDRLKTVYIGAPYGHPQHVNGVSRRFGANLYTAERGVFRDPAGNGYGYDFLCRY